LLNPLVRMIQHRLKINRKASVIIVFFLFLIIVGIAGTLTVTKAIGQLVNFVEDIPTYINQINNLYIQWENNFQSYASNLPPEFVQKKSYNLQDNLNAIKNTHKKKNTIDNIGQIFSKIPPNPIWFLVHLIGPFPFMLELPLLKSKT